MMRNIHFFDLKPGVAFEDYVQAMADFEAYTLANGCTERRTLKLHDAHSGGEAVESQQYMNESLWPSIEAADATMAAMPQDIKAKAQAVRAMLANWKTVRYVDVGE